MAHDPNYAAAWRRYRLLARIRLVALLGLVPYIAAVGAITLTLGADLWAAIPYVIAWFVFTGFSSAAVLSWACPRCGKTFFRTWWWNSPFASECVHCELPKWAGADFEP